MLGTRIRSWMEAHISRARKRSGPSGRSAKQQGKAKQADRLVSRPPPLVEEKLEDVKVAGTGGVPKDSSAYSVTGRTEGHGVSLSSPESAYSTGYSTDGTSPGASVPPEYYINLRTGKHYVQATGNATGGGAGGGAGGGGGGEVKGTPGRRRREEAAKRWRGDQALPGSSTEEDIADRAGSVSLTGQHQRLPTPKAQKKVVQNELTANSFHRRTESYDDSQRRSFLQTERDSEGSSSTTTQTTGASVQSCGSPFMSASPRQRTRIRTNPWLGAEGRGAKAQHGSQTETSSTVGSSSTLSSTGCKERPVVRPDYNNINSIVPSTTFIASPLLNCGGRRVVDKVTTCSPQPNRPCRHQTPCRLPTSSSSEARSSGSDRGNTSDFSDDDVTLNEMLGKYDESYVYDKETDILSDSDPTDCDERCDLNDNSSRLVSERDDDLDFIDTGSLAEIAFSDSEHSDKLINRGHCTYMTNSATHTPEMCKRQCSSRARRSRERSSRGSSRSPSLGQGRPARQQGGRPRRDDLSQDPPTPRRYRKKRQSSKDSRKSVESLPKEPPPVPSRGWIAPGLEAERRLGEGGGRQMNLNRVLMERLIQNQRSGTRSADGTPVSLRRHATEYNGKYLRNPHVSKLISSNPPLPVRVPSSDRTQPTETSTIKKRSTSASVNPPPVPARTYVKHKEVEKEDDLKYRKLIQEAENIFEDFHRSSRPDYLSPTLSTRSAIFPAPRPPSQTYFGSRIPNKEEIDSQIDLLQETINNNTAPKFENEEGIFKTISKTLEKIIIRNNDVKKSDKNSDTIKSKKKNQNKAHPPLSIFNTETFARENDYVNNPIPIPIDALPDSNDNLYRDYTYSPPPLSDEHIKLFNSNLNSNYKQGYTNNKKEIRSMKSFDDGFPQGSPARQIAGKRSKPKDLSSSWHGRRAMAELLNGNEPQQATTPLAEFKAFDLGNVADPTAKYCPQSEPVKRKVYACSSTFDKLQKSLMREETSYDVPDLPTEVLRDENTSLKEKVAALRRERLQVEARVRETQEQIDRLRLAEAASHS